MADGDGPAGSIRVVVADDHAIVREGLRALLATEPGMELVGEAADGEGAVAQAGALRPDVVLLDLVMPRSDGLQAIPAIARASPSSRILVLTSFAADDQLFPALQAGALGYLLKDSSPRDLLRAIREVARGEASLHPAVARRVLGELTRSAAPAAPLGPPPGALSEREVEVLRLVAQGLSNQAIADRLVVGERTVRTHVSSVLRKLHLANRTQAALYALREGLAGLDRPDPA